MLYFVLIYSHSCLSKPVWLTFFSRTEECFKCWWPQTTII